MAFCGWFIEKTFLSFISSFSENFGDQYFKLRYISIAKFSALQCACLAGIRRCMISEPTRKKSHFLLWVSIKTNKQALPNRLIDLGIKHFQIDYMQKVQCVSMAGVGRRVISHPRRKKVQYESMARWIRPRLFLLWSLSALSGRDILPCLKEALSIKVFKILGF